MLVSMCAAWYSDAYYVLCPPMAPIYFKINVNCRHYITAVCWIFCFCFVLRNSMAFLLIYVIVLFMLVWMTTVTFILL